MTENTNYAYDIISTTNWYDNIDDYDNYIRNHLDDILENNNFDFSDDKITINNIKEHVTHLFKFRTYSGEILNKNILEKISLDIKNIYTTTEKIINSTSSHDNLVKNIVTMLLDLKNIEKDFSIGIKSISSEEKINFHKQYINNKNIKANFYSAKNPNIIKYGLYPEFIGKDISKNSLDLTSSEINSVEFVSSSLFGWKYTSPQRRSFGSCSHLGAIIGDILFKKINKSEIFNNSIFENDSKNTDIINNLYENLLKNNSVLRDLFDGMMNEIPKSETEIPKLYFLYVLHSTRRNPFYKDKMIKKNKNVKFGNYIKYILQFDTDLKKITLKDNSSNIKKNNLKSNISELINDMKLALKFNKEDVISSNNVANSFNTSFANQSENEIINYIEKINQEDMLKIITHIITITYIELLLFCHYNTKYSNKLNFKSNNIGYSFPKLNNYFNNDIILVLKKHEELYNNYLRILQKNLEIQHSILWVVYLLLKKII